MGRGTKLPGSGIFKFWHMRYAGQMTHRAGWFFFNWYFGLEIDNVMQGTPQFSQDGVIEDWLLKNWNMSDANQQGQCDIVVLGSEKSLPTKFVTFLITEFIVLFWRWRYFFPTFENDSLLCALTDADGTNPHNDTASAVTEVTAEDLPDIVNALALQWTQTFFFNNLLWNQSTIIIICISWPVTYIHTASGDGSSNVSRCLNVQCQNDSVHSQHWKVIHLGSNGEKPDIMTNKRSK